MKKCGYCGREYSNDIERCSIDDELLSAPEGQPLPVVEADDDTISSSSFVLTDRQMRLVEVVLVCLITFGPSIFSSAYQFSHASEYVGVSSGSSGYGLYKWTVACLRAVLALGLLWYVLIRRGKSFSDLGLNWARYDFVRSIILSIGGAVAFFLVDYGIYYMRLTSVSYRTAANYVGRHLFGDGISVMTWLYQCINPFLEELIVRAYLMTEVKYFTNSAAKAVIISTIVQTSYHFYQGAPAAFADGAEFLIFSVYYAKTNRIGPIILAHLYDDIGYTLAYALRR